MAENEEDGEIRYRVGVFLGSMSGSFYGRVIKELLQAAKDNGILLEFFSGGFSEKAGKNSGVDFVYALAKNAALDALIILADFFAPLAVHRGEDDPENQPTWPLDIPVYSMFSPLQHTFSAVIDEEDAVVTMMRHLISRHGYKKFAVLCGSDLCANGNTDRFGLITRELEAAGLSLPDKMVFRGELSEKTGKSAATELLALPKEEFPEVILSMNEETGTAALEILASRGIHVPFDIAFVGFNDNAEMSSNHTARSTVDYPVWEMVAFVMNRIVSDLSGKTVFTPSAHTFQAAFIVHNSCGCNAAADAPVSELDEELAEESADAGKAGDAASGTVELEAVSDEGPAVSDDADRFFSGDLKQIDRFKKSLNLIAEECVGKADMNEIGEFMKKTVAMLREGGGVSSDFMDAFSTQWMVTLLRHPEPQEQMLINSAFIDANRMLYKTQQEVAMEIKKADTGLLEFYESCNDIMLRKESVVNGLREIGVLLPAMGFSFLYIFLRQKANSSKFEYRLGYQKDKMFFVPEKDFAVFDVSSKEKTFLTAPEFFRDIKKSFAVYSIAHSDINFGYLVFSVDEKHFKNFSKVRQLISHMIESLTFNEYTKQQLSELRHKNSELSKLSLIDEFTKLGNRRALFVNGKADFDSAVKRGKSVCVIFIDMDGLKHINDTFGHAEGDRAILAFSQILRRCFRKTDMIIRYGGDEFVVLAIGFQKTAQRETFKRIAGQIEKYNAENQNPWKLSASWGYEYLDPERDAPIRSFEEMLRLSDDKLYEEKRKKKGTPSAENPTAS